MPSIADLSYADVSLAFTDWGRTAELIETVASYDPATGQLEATETVTTIVVIPVDSSISQWSSTTSLVPIGRRTYLVRKSDLLSGTVPTSARIQIDSRTYEIQSVSETSLNGVLALECATDGRHDHN